MQFDKPKIDLVQEIRRRAAAKAKPGIKLANPELLHELLDLYHDGADTVTKTLIKELFTMAGDPWPQSLQQESEPSTRYVTKVYRGQTQLVPASHEPREEPRKKPQRVYRGQVIS